MIGGAQCIKTKLFLLHVLFFVARFFVTHLIFSFTFYVNLELYSTFAGQIWASYSSYEDDIDTNRILIQRTKILTVRNPPFELSGIDL